APASTSASTSAAGKPLLTESEKRSNHIQSEQRRRASIRDGFAQLVSLIPAGGAAVMRSEAVVLQEAVRYIEQLLSDRTQLIARVEGLKRRTGDSSR
ncbi:helix-loop-helix DNA-binding domain-containing protein, partial [Caulochytrium protostelioides]